MIEVIAAGFFPARNALRAALNAAPVLLLAAAAHAGDAPWAFRDSPYRAVMKLKDAPRMPDTGIEIELPEFGQTRTDMSDLELTDAKGQPVPLARLWRGEGRNVLLVAKELAPGEEYYLYCGAAVPHSKLTWQPKPSLLMETRRAPEKPRFDTWPEMEDTWRRAAANVEGMAFVRWIFQGENPFGESSNFLTRYTGYLWTTDAKQLTLFTVSSDASFVLVEGKMDLEWPGSHGGQSNDKNAHQKTVTVSGGLTKIEYYHAKASGGAPAMALGWKQGNKFETIPADKWLHAGTSEVVRLEASQDRPVPSPAVRLDSYIGYNDQWLFETTCSLPGQKLDGWTVEWQFADGSIFQGNECKRIIPGLDSQKVAVTLTRGRDRLAGARLIMFNSTPHEASIKNQGDVKRYMDLIAKEMPARLSSRTLKADLNFVREFGDDAQIAPLAEAFVQKNRDGTDPVWLPAQLARLRALAQTDPKRALTELRAIDPVARKKHANELDLLEIELLTFYLRDPLAVNLARQYAFSHKEPEVARLLNIRIGDYYRITGRYADATAQYQTVQKTVVEESGGKKLPAQDRAYSITINDLLGSDHRREAEAKMIEWETRHPMAKLDSDFLLLRGRLLMGFGRWQEALMEFESFEKMQPESPFQIEADFYRARSLFELGKKDEAKKIWDEIATKYPKHELAAASKQWAAKK